MSPEVDVRLARLKAELDDHAQIAHYLGLDFERPIRSIGDGYPENAVALVGKITERLLKQLWRHHNVPGTPAGKQLKDLISGCRPYIRSHRVVESLHDIQRLRNRSAHDGYVVADEDGLTAVRRLLDVLAWYTSTGSGALSEHVPKLAPAVAAKAEFLAGLYLTLDFKPVKRFELSRHTVYQLFMRERGLRSEYVELLLSRDVEDVATVLQARLRTGTCAGCGALTSLPGLNATGQPICTRCSGIPARFRCCCGRQVTAGERGRCWWCVLAELVTDVLAGPGGQVPTHLRPLAEGLVSMRRPQSGVVWLRRSATARQTLRDLAHGRILCSHAAVDALGADRAVEYLRCLLVRYGVLPPRDRRLADFQRWAAAKLGGVGNAEHRQVLERFLRWRLLRHLRSGSTTAAPVGHGPYQRAKQRLTVAAAFLVWLADRGRQLGECTQHDLDQWFGTGPTTRRHVITFLSWARHQRILRNVDVPAFSPGGAEACQPGSDARLAAIRRLLLDETLAPGDRIAGCLVVLYGQQVSKIAALRTTEVSCGADAARLRLGADWLDVPEPIAALLRQHLRDLSSATTAANPASSWLFPGQLAGEHRSYRRLVRVLHQLGIPARASRLAAWREMVRQAPPAVLADALGVSPGTAMRHAVLGGADWSAYAARRVPTTNDGTSRVCDTRAADGQLGV